MKTKLSLVFAIAAIVAVCGLTEMSFAQTAAVGMGKSKVELVTVYEKTFADSIVDVALDEAWVTPQKATVLGWKETKSLETKNGLFNIAYPKVVVTRKALQFYTGDAKLKKTISLKSNEGIIRSSNGQYLVKRLQGALAESGASIFDWNGVILGKIIKGQVKEISNSGTILVAEDCPEDIGFPAYYVMYDKSGKETGRFKVPERFSYAEGGGVKLAEEGDNFIVAFGMYGKKDSSTYYLVSKKGEVLWETEMSYTITGSMPNDHIGVSGLGIFGITDIFMPKPFSKTYFSMIDWKGKEKWQVPIHLRENMYCKLSPDYKSVYVMSGAGYIWCIDIETGKTLWQHREVWSPISSTEWPKNVPAFRQIHILLDGNNNSYVIVNGMKEDISWRPYLSTILVFNGKNGNVISIKEYNNPVHVVESPKHKFLFLKDSNAIKAIKISGGM